MMHHKSKKKKISKRNLFLKNFFFSLFRCEFTDRNPNGCQSNQYFTQIEAVPTIPGSQLVTGKIIHLR